MSSNTIVNAAPMTILRGTQDLSIRTPLIEAEVLPTHLPKVYIYAQKGPTSPQLVVGNSRNQMYGDDTFDLRKPYANHATVLSNVVNAKGNAQMIERIVPTDVYFKSNLLLSLEISEVTDVPSYQRDSDGNYVLDSLYRKTLVSGDDTVPGYFARWVLSTPEYNDYNSSVSAPGFTEAPTRSSTVLVTKTTTGVGGGAVETTVATKIYPILRLEASSFGEYFNNAGIRLWAPTTDTGINESILESLGAFPFRIQVIRRASVTATAGIVATEFAESNFDFTFKPGQINPATDALFSLGDIFLDKYQNLKDTRFPMKLGDFGRIHIFQNNIDTINEMVYAQETLGAKRFELAYTKADANAVNIVSGKYANAVPYYNLLVGNTIEDTAGKYKIEFQDDVGTYVSLSSSTNLYASLGFDGTMFDAPFAAGTDEYIRVAKAIADFSPITLASGAPLPPSFAELVSEKVSQYADPNSYLQDTAVYPESIIYDSGFPNATKYDLIKFISERKDTAVVLSTYDVNGSPMTASEEHSVAVALRTHLQAYPESDYFGTAVMRGMVVGRYGTLRNSQYTRQLPLTLEVASKAADMMGAGDGRWKTEMVFDRAPNSEINMFDSVNVTFTPAAVRNKDWDVGLNWVQAFSRKNLFFPALKTAYDNDTSVLNSFFTVMACVELQKVGERVWRRFSGSVSLTNAQLIDRVNATVEEMTIGRFAGLYKIVPAAYLTDADLVRGYSWTLPIKIYANNMKTVMTLSLQAYRMTDYSTK